MPIVQGSALWNLQRVFNHPRSSKETETKDAKSVPSSSSSFWKSTNASSLFLKFSSTPCHSPKRSASAPQGLPQKSTPNPCTSSSPAEVMSTNESSITKSTSAPHTLISKPNFLQILVDSKNKASESPSDSKFSSPQNLSSPSESPFLIIHSLDSSSPNISPAKPDSQNPQEPYPGPSDLPDNLSLKPLPSKLSAPKPTSKEASDEQLSASNPTPGLQNPPPCSPSPRKTTASQSNPSRHASCSSTHSSPAQSPLKSHPLHSSRRASTQGEQLPVTPSPPWSELMEARRRLMAVECRRRALCALEMRVQQVHYVFLQAEMRVARQKEGLAKLVEAAGRAEVQTAVHGQRIRKALRRHKPRLLACALCVPWPSKTERRSVQHPRHSRCAVFQGRIQVLRGCVGSDELTTRE